MDLQFETGFVEDLAGKSILQKQSHGCKFSGLFLNNRDFGKSHWNTNGKHWFTTVIPETFSMGI